MQLRPVSRGVAALAAVAFALVSPHAAAAAPPNDDFDSATPIGSLPYTDALQYQDATGSVDDPSTCGGGRSERTLWYKLTPAASQRVKLSTDPGDVPIDVFVGSRGALTRVPAACLWNPGAADVRFDAVAGTTYYVMLSPSSAWQVDISFKAEVGPTPPANDDFDDATVIEEFTFADTLDSGAATAWPDDPLCHRQLHMGVWYRYTAPAQTRIHIDTIGSTFEAAFGVYTGSRGNLSLVGECRSGTIWQQPQLDFTAQAGRTYQILVGSMWAAGGTLSFQFRARIISTLTLSAARSTIDYGRTLRLTARLNRFLPGTSPTISIYKQSGGLRELVASGGVDADGVLTVALRPEANTRYLAGWSGDEQYSADETGRLQIRVRVITRGELFRHFGRSGAYKLYRRGVNPVYAYSVTPNHHRREVIISFQHLRSGRWRNVVRGQLEFPLNSESEGAVAVNARVLTVGTRYRIRARFPGDGDHAGDVAAWRYFRVTG
ncbi:MAG TPA: hypothetical protein VD769_04555 [Gaiellaceae bacterium]|nr:hypothetical protein [Gaiellaceae bacterium]